MKNANVSYKEHKRKRDRAVNAVFLLRQSANVRRSLEIVEYFDRDRNVRLAI